MREQWIRMAEFNNEYEISNTGRVRKSEQLVDDVYLICRIIPAQYLKIYRGGKVKINGNFQSMFRLMAAHFKFDNPKNFPHLTQKKSNYGYGVDNLHYGYPEKKVCYADEYSSKRMSSSSSMLSAEQHFWENF